MKGPRRRLHPMLSTPPSRCSNKQAAREDRGQPPHEPGKPQLWEEVEHPRRPFPILLLFLLSSFILLPSPAIATSEGSCSPKDDPRGPQQGGEPPLSPPPFLATFLGPQPGMGPFFREFWQQKPSVQQRQKPAYFKQILSMEEVDHILAFGVGVMNESSPTMVLGEDWNLVKRAVGPDEEFWSGTPSFEASVGSGALDKAHDAFRRGFSLVVNHMEVRWAPIAMLTAALEEESGYRTSVNLYMTPPDSQGFEAHFDWMDVFILQVEGSKIWRLYDPLVELPRPDLKFKPTRRQIGDPFIEFALEAGDTLYLPAGLIHEAHTLGLKEPSLHITAGLETTVVGSWESLLFHTLALLTEGGEGKGDKEGLLRCGPSGRGSLQPRLQALASSQQPPLKYGDLLLATLLNAGRQDVLLRRSVPYTRLVQEQSQAHPLTTLQGCVAHSLARHLPDLPSALAHMASLEAGSITSRGFVTQQGEVMLERLEKAFRGANRSSSSSSVREWEEKGRAWVEEGVFQALVEDWLCVIRSKDGGRWMVKAFEDMAKEDLFARRRSQMENLARCDYSQHRDGDPTPSMPSSSSGGGGEATSVT